MTRAECVTQILVALMNSYASGDPLNSLKPDADTDANAIRSYTREVEGEAVFLQGVAERMADSIGGFSEP